MVANNFEEGVQRAMGLLQNKNNAPSTQNNDFESGVKKAMQLLQNPEQNAEPEYSWGDRALQVARGVAKTYGGIADLASEYRQGHPTMMADLATNFEPVQKVPEGAEIPKVTPILTGKIDEFSGKDLTPTDDTGKFLEGVGEFAAPLPVPGNGAAVKTVEKGVKAFTKGLGKKVVKEVVPAVSASAAVNLTPELTEEGSAGRVIEDLAKIIIGTKAGDKLSSPEVLRAVKRITNLKDTSEKTAAKLLSMGSTPNKEILDLAKEKGIELPFNIGANNKSHNFLANNYLKSMFVSDAYKQVLKNADEQMVNSVKNAIDTLGDSRLLPNEASSEYRNFLKQDELKFKAGANKLYDEARDLLKTTESITPKNTIESLQSEAVKDLLNKISPSDAEKKVINRIKEISGKLLGETALPKSISEDTQRIKGAKEAYQKATQKESKVSVKDLIDLRSSLMNTLDYDTEVRGVEAYLSRLVGDLSKDIEGYGNKAFVEKWKEANQFFKQNIADRFRTDIARSLMTGEVPLEAFNKMNSVGNIRELKKIAGESEKGQEIFNALSKAKLREIFSNAFTDGSLQAGNFYKLFDKKEKTRELIKELIGPTEYKNLEEIGRIAAEFSKAGKELLNTSGTAIASSDITKAEQLVKTTLGTLFGGSIGYATGGLPAAVLGVAMPNIISRIVANPKIINQAHAYALAHQAGKGKEAQSILKRLVRMVDAETATKAGQYFAVEEMNNNQKVE